MDELEGMTEEELQLLMELGIAPEQMDSIQRQRKTAEELRYGAGPQGRDTGRTFVAANPLEHLANGIQRYQAKKDMDRLGSEETALLGRTVEGRKTFYDMLRGKGRNSSVDPGAPNGDVPAIAERSLSELAGPTPVVSPSSGGGGGGGGGGGRGAAILDALTGGSRRGNGSGPLRRFKRGTPGMTPVEELNEEDLMRLRRSAGEY